MLDPERIRLRRHTLRLSQAVLGKRIGQDQAYISRLEQGKTTSMTIGTLERLADALGTSADYLLGRSEDSGGPHAS
jgi:transcriptional regulator with XRE-family HTH domain